MTELSIAEIRDSLKRDHSEVLKTLYTDYHDYCLSNVQSKLNLDTDDAKDLFIEALLIFRRNVLSGKVEHLTSLKSYMLSICLNLGREKFRADKRADKHTDEIEMRLYDHSQPDADENSRKQQALQAFATLSEGCQKVLTLFYVHRLSMKEVAEEQGLANEQVAKVQKARCMRKWEKTIKNLTHGIV